MPDREPVTVIQATHIIRLHKLRAEYVATVTAYDDKGKATNVLIGKDADAMTAIIRACEEAGIPVGNERDNTGQRMFYWTEG